MNLASLGSICVFEHMFDKKFEHIKSKEYDYILSTDYNLVRNTVLNGGKAQIQNVIDVMNDKTKFLHNLRLSSAKEWICQDDMHFVVHNNYGGKNYQSQSEMLLNIDRLFDAYRDIDVFMYYAYDFKNFEQMQQILNACRNYNANAKLLCFSNLEDQNINEEIINIHICQEILFDTQHILNGCRRFENAWNIPIDVIDKLHGIRFDETLFKEYKF